jgi:hypothetical protein
MTDKQITGLIKINRCIASCVTTPQLRNAIKMLIRFKVQNPGPYSIQIEQLMLSINSTISLIRDFIRISKIDIQH